MKIAIASFTRNGCVWNQKLCAALKKHSCEGYALEKYGKEAGIPAIAPSLPAWTERMFQEMDAILFIGACGIAVRSIAPYVKSKKTDPAVLCMDEQGKFVISLLSGHIGGKRADGRSCSCNGCGSGHYNGNGCQSQVCGRCLCCKKSL